MIGKLTGTVDYIGADHILLDVSGVGYKVFVTNELLMSRPAGMPISVFTEMIVREDQISLYGFQEMAEKEWFNLLQTVQGIGARMAISLLSSMSISELQMAILSEDDKAFKKISGIGAKIAQRIVIELKNKKEVSSSIHAFTPSTATDESTQVQDAIAALVGLGFSKTEAYHAVTQIKADNDNINIEDLIKHSLLKLSSLT